MFARATDNKTTDHGRGACAKRRLFQINQPIQLAKAPPQRQYGQASDTEQAQGGSRFGHRPNIHVKLIVGGARVSLLNQKGICPRGEREGKTGRAWGEAWVCHPRQQIDADR